MTDRLSVFLSGRAPDHKQNQHFLIPEMTGQPAEQLRKFQRQLQSSPGIIFERLLQDIYDEVDRREVNSQVGIDKHFTLCEHLGLLLGVGFQWLSTEHYRVGSQQHVALFLPVGHSISTATMAYTRGLVGPQVLCHEKSTQTEAGEIRDQRPIPAHYRCPEGGTTTVLRPPHTGGREGQAEFNRVATSFAA